MIRAGLATVLFFIASGQAVADGKLEINQTCALHGGCFSGDSAGFPVTIDGSAGKSYYLTGDLDLSAIPAISAIEVDAPYVTLNLNGFEIAGPVSCSGSGAAIDCGGIGDGDGVSLNTNAKYLVVRNGTIRNMARHGVGPGIDNLTIRDITARHNAADGFNGGSSSIIANSYAIENGADGFEFGVGSIVDRSIAEGNGDNGFELDVRKAVVVGSVARRNGGQGFQLGPWSKFRDNVSDSNAEPNRCGGGICTNEKRFYLTRTDHEGNDALDACVDGFHFASVTEIIDVTSWTYDPVLGPTKDDSGKGVPDLTWGWVRSGSDSSPGRNCSAWTSNEFGDEGTVAEVLTVVDFDNAEFNYFPWKITEGGFFGQCQGSIPVWCAEDQE